MKKRILCIFLALALVMGLPVTALATEDTRIAYASTQTVDIDGTPVELQAYALKDENGYPTNYVKLRDVAYVLNGTEAQFEVEWDGNINLVTGSPYTANGSEMSTPFSGDRRYTVSTAVTMVNGSVSNLSAITLTDGKGGAYTYYKLRDLGTALDFVVDWSAERGIYIETAKPQTVDLEPLKCVINPTGNGQWKCVNAEVDSSGWCVNPNTGFELRWGVTCTDIFGRTMYGIAYTDEEVTERYGITIKDGFPTNSDHLPDYESYYNETGNMVYHDEYGISWARTSCGCGSAVGWKCIGDTGRWAEAPMKCTVVADYHTGTYKTWCIESAGLQWEEYPQYLKNLNDACHATDEELTAHFGVAFKDGIPVSTDHLPDAKTHYDNYRNGNGDYLYTDEYGLQWGIVTCNSRYNFESDDRCDNVVEWSVNVPKDHYGFTGTANN